MKLIIAEKPSMARAIMEALRSIGEQFTKEDDGEYYRSSSFFVTSQFGHLLELADIDNYPENEGKNMWESANLPFFPTSYSYIVKTDAQKRFSTIKKLLSADEVDEVLHCGDPDREGQVLVDLVLAQLKCKKKITRPLLKVLTPDAIIEAISTRKDNQEYANWRMEGLARMYMDFDYGINLSRYATAKTHARPSLNVGRVIGAVVTEIYNRDCAIANFRPEKYYKVESDLNGIKLTSKKKFTLAAAEQAAAYAANLNQSPALVQDISRKQTEKKSPRLFSQTTLQAYMNKYHGCTPDQTLQLAQRLYEQGYTTYPRTNTEYLAEAEKAAISDIIDIHNNDGDLTFKDTKQIFDDSKIDGHSAITPTKKRPSNLSADEEHCYQAILCRFKSVFCGEPCIFDQTKVCITCGEESFTLKGESLVKPGWQRYSPAEKKERELPNLEINQIVEIDFVPLEAETSPPKHHTVESLGRWMQNPFQKDNDTIDDTEAYKNILAGLEIGTEATRAMILKKAQDKGYIELKKTTYRILPRGEFLISSCKALGIDMSKEKTAEIGRRTKQVYTGETTIKEVLSSTRKEVSEIISANRAVAQDSNNVREPLGNCPICGKAVYENAKSYCCSGYKDGCKFVIWKEIAGKKLTVSQAKTLLQGKTTSELKGFKGKSGNGFSAALRLNPIKHTVEFVFKSSSFGTLKSKKGGNPWIR